MASSSHGHDPVTATFERAQDRLVLQASDLSLESIASMVDSSAIDVRPEFQRRERWSSAQASALIESFLLNIPVPPVYLAEEEFGQYSVIDGKQRITAISQFMRDDLQLTRLTRFEELESHRFSSLPPSLRNALQVRPYIRVVTLLRQSDPVVKYEVFHRLNSGGEPLNPQEIRNVIFRGPLNDLIMELSAHPYLRSRLKIRDVRASGYRTMQDVEYVLRYFTLESIWMKFSGDFRTSMDHFMSQNQHANQSFIRKHEEKFLRAIEACEKIWGEYAFRRFDNGQWRNQTLGGLYDAQMVAVSWFKPNQIGRLVQRSADVLQATKELFEDAEFDGAVRTATNNPARVSYRVDKVISMLNKLI